MDNEHNIGNDKDPDLFHGLFEYYFDICHFFYTDKNGSKMKVKGHRNMQPYLIFVISFTHITGVGISDDGLT